MLVMLMVMEELDIFVEVSRGMRGNGARIMGEEGRLECKVTSVLTSRESWFHFCKSHK